MIMMMAIIHVLFGQQTQQDETSFEADPDQDPSQMSPARACTHSWVVRATLTDA
jgi:hypothetical protein